MIDKINEVVINTLKNYNSEFAKLTIANNILTLDQDKIDLENFNLETIFESYQLKLDLNNMKAQELFDIIKLNALIYNSNEEGEL